MLEMINMIYKCISGKEFREIYHNVRFYKLTTVDEIHNNFKFNDGINEDHILFEPTGKCQKGGLYFIYRIK